MIDNLSPLRKPNKITEIITDKIRQMIEEGILKPGDKLPTEKELCEGFGVGRSSVREALQGLEYMGLIESRPGVGRFLSSDSDVLLRSENWRFTLDKASAFELMEARGILEVSAAELAAERASDEVIKKLKELLDVMGKVMDSDMDLFFDKELQFHLTLAGACQNSVLVDLIDGVIHRVTKDSERFLRTLPYTFSQTVEQFQAIVRALEEGDPVLAGQKMDEHLDLVRYALGKGEEGL